MIPKLICTKALSWISNCSAQERLNLEICQDSLPHLRWLKEPQNKFPFKKIGRYLPK